MPRKEKYYEKLVDWTDGRFLVLPRNVNFCWYRLRGWDGIFWGVMSPIVHVCQRKHAGKIFKKSSRQVWTVNVWTWCKPKRAMTPLIFEVKDWPKVVFVNLLHNARWFQNKSQLYFRLLDIESACIYPPAWGGLSGSNSCSGLLFGC